MKISGEIIMNIFTSYDLVAAFIVVALTMYASYALAKSIKQERMGSAIAIIFALVIAFIGGKVSGGTKGIADISMFSGMGVLGGAMFRDYAIISTGYGADLSNLKKAGIPGIVSLFLGIFVSFFAGVVVAFALGYRDVVDLTTIGGGAVTFVVGPVTGDALGASSEVIALSIAAGVVKSVVTMILTPLVAKKVKLDSPEAAIMYGGLIGTTSGVAGGLAATDPELVPYGAMTATFYTGLGTLLIPSVGYFIVNSIF